MESSEHSENTKSVKKDGMGFYRFALCVLKPLTWLFFRPEYIGRENVPEEGAAFVCSNHISNWDVILLALAVRRPMHYMAKKELFNVFGVRKLVAALGAFPVNREAADLNSVRTTLGFIREGEMVGVFPQGHRYTGLLPRDTTPKGGLGMFVQRSGATVVPAAVVSEGRRIRLFRHVKIVIGKPITPDSFADLDRSSESYRKISDTVFEHICLLEESNHDNG